MRHLFALSLICTLAACGDGSAEVVALRFKTSALIDGEIAITKSSGANLIGVEGLDADGNAVNASDDIVWETGDAELVEIHPLGEAVLCIGTKDWFDTPIPEPDGGADGSMPADPMADAPPPEHDAGMEPTDAGVPSDMRFEPRATIMASYGDTSIAVTVAVVLNVAGKWQVFRDGMVDKPFAELDLQQTGRKLSDPITGASGTLAGNVVTLQQDALTLQGTLTSRTEASGTYVGPLGITGAWSAVRRPDASTP
jgi:hypothetical protein